MTLEGSNVRDVVELRLPSAPEYIRLARLTVAGIATQLGFSFDEVEDLKIAVAEACTNALLYGCNDNREQDIIVRYVVEPQKLTIHVVDQGDGFDCTEIKAPVPEDLNPGGLGLFFIRALVDEAEFLGCPQRGTEVRMVKYLQEAVTNG